MARHDPSRNPNKNTDMIASSPNPLSSPCTFMMDSVPVLYSSIVEYELTLSENKHDLLVVTLAGLPPKLATDYIGIPVSFNLGSGAGRSQTFNGYVAYTEPVSNTRDGFINGSPIQMARLYCLGASMVMKEINSRVYDSPTLGEIVEELAGKYKFSADYPKDTYTPVRLTQSTESDWSFLNKVCKAFGLTFSLHGTHLHVWDKNKYSGRLASYHRAIPQHKLQSNTPFSIMDFEATLGRISSSGNASKSLITVLDSQGNIHTVTDYETDMAVGSNGITNMFKKPLYNSVNSLEEGHRFVDQTDKSNMIYNGKMTVMYGAGAVPGGAVELTGYSSDFDGLWYITEVKHSIKSSNYITEVLISKPAKYTEIPDYSRVTSYKEASGSKLIEDRWTAATPKVEEYA